MAKSLKPIWQLPLNKLINIHGTYHYYSGVAQSTPPGGLIFLVRLKAWGGELKLLSIYCTMPDPVAPSFRTFRTAGRVAL